MGRRLGSKNISKEEREARKAGKHLLTPEEERQATEHLKKGRQVGKTKSSSDAQEQQGDVLTAINGLASFVQQGFQQFDQRISAMENGKTVQTTMGVAPVTEPGHTTMPVMQSMVPSTMEVDNTLPPAPTELMAGIGAEADAMIQSQGLDKIKPTERPNLGRHTPSFKDLRCAVCGRPPGKNIRVTDADFRPDADGKYHYIHENCHGKPLG